MTFMDELPIETKEWLSSSLFPSASGVQPSGTGSEICEHLAGHGTEFLVCRESHEDVADFPEVVLPASGESQHHAAEDLLDDVKNLEV